MTRTKTFEIRRHRPSGGVRTGCLHTIDVMEISIFDNHHGVVPRRQIGWDGAGPSWPIPNYWHLRLQTGSWYGAEQSYHLQSMDAPLECGRSPKQKSRTPSYSWKETQRSVVYRRHTQTQVTASLLGATRLSEEDEDTEVLGIKFYLSSHNLQYILATKQTAAPPCFSAWPRPMDHHG